MKSSGDVNDQTTLSAQIDYEFDCRGLFHNRAFRCPALVEEARRKFDELSLAPEDWAPSQYRASNIHSSAFRELAHDLHQHPITRRLVGYPPRLLESYAIKRVAGALDLHGGASEFLVNSGVRDVSAHSWVHDGQLYTLRLKVLVYLDDVISTADGPFLYIEGSHKSAFSFHHAFDSGRRDSVAANLIRHVELRAGDAVWLNEALLHGAGEKTSKTSRRVLAFTFGPTFMADWQVLETPSLSGSGYFAAQTEQG